MDRRRSSECDRDEECAGCGCHLSYGDGNVCPACGSLDKAIPRKRFVQ